MCSLGLQCDTAVVPTATMYIIFCLYSSLYSSRSSLFCRCHSTTGTSPHDCIQATSQSLHRRRYSTSSTQCQAMRRRFLPLMSCPCVAGGFTKSTRQASRHACMLCACYWGRPSPGSAFVLCWHNSNTTRYCISRLATCICKCQLLSLLADCWAQVILACAMGVV